MTADVTFQPPVGLAPVVGFQAPVTLGPMLGFQPPVASQPDLALTRPGSFQASIGLSTPMVGYNSLHRRESFSLLNRSVESLDALRLRMSEQFRATTSETWRPSRDTFKTPDMAR